MVEERHSGQNSCLYNRIDVSTHDIDVSITDVHACIDHRCRYFDHVSIINIDVSITHIHVSIIDVDVSITDVHVSIIDVNVSILDSYVSISSIDVDVGCCDIRYH